jgi:hypothetical protein
MKLLLLGDIVSGGKDLHVGWSYFVTMSAETLSSSVIPGVTSMGFPNPYP